MTDKKKTTPKSYQSYPRNEKVRAAQLQKLPTQSTSRRLGGKLVKGVNAK